MSESECLEKWRDSLKRIRATGCRKVAVTHFGIYPDAAAHLDYASRTLDQVEDWLEQVMPEIQDVETYRQRYIIWLHELGRAAGEDEATRSAYDFKSPASMGAGGLFRSWQKFRLAK